MSAPLQRPHGHSAAPVVYDAFLVGPQAVALTRSPVTGGALLLVEGGQVSLSPAAAAVLIEALARFVADAGGV